MAKTSKRQRTLMKQRKIAASATPGTKREIDIPFPEDFKKFCAYVCKERNITDKERITKFVDEFYNECVKEPVLQCAVNLGAVEALSLGLIQITPQLDGTLSISTDIGSLRSWCDIKMGFKKSGMRKLFYTQCIIDCLLEVMEMMMQAELLYAKDADFDISDNGKNKYLGILRRRMDDVRYHLHKSVAPKIDAYIKRYGECAADDSDWLKEIIYLCIDRVGDNPDERVPMLKRAILRLKSNMDGMYEEFYHNA